jgi:hypothetical protein
MRSAGGTHAIVRDGVGDLHLENVPEPRLRKPTHAAGVLFYAGCLWREES